MDFVVGDVVRQGFGFANPNHAAAAICALFPFCWGWRGKWRWAGRIVGVALCVMLAMTYSRTGMLLIAIEAVLLWGGRKILLPGMIGHAETSTRSTRSTRLKKMQGRGGLATSVAVAVAVAAIAQPVDDIAEAAFDRIVMRIAGRAPAPAEISLPSPLVVQKSTKMKHLGSGSL